MTDCKICYLSTHISGAVKLDFLQGRGLAIDCIANPAPDSPCVAGVCGYHDFASQAERYGSTLYRPHSLALDDPRDADFFRDNGFDILLISGWQRLVPQVVLDTLRVGAVAEHGSSEYLPKGRGRSPLGWTIIQGRGRFVVHLFIATAEADAGAVIDCEPFTITQHDTIASGYAKVGIVSGRLFLKNLPRLLDGTWEPKKTADVEPTYFPRRGEADDFLDFTKPVQMLYDHVRACAAPYPGAKARLGGDVLTLWAAAPFDCFMEDIGAAVGEVLAVLPDGGFVVKAVDGALLVTDYQPQGSVAQGDVLA